ncbi:hypothetical protein BX600DRAFT_429941 [Xylariales sp. PMI_506]|nr:hypothetical protein BX600DRAFT_429941 [Xylariales sp. PMI_506]
MRVLILGSGPAGLATAISLAKLSTPASPLSITVVELRSSIQTLGGAVHLTSQALSALDKLGVLQYLKPKGAPCSGIDKISMMEGTKVGVILQGDGMRVRRHDIVTTMFETAQKHHSDTVTVRFGMRVVSIDETETVVVLKFENGETLEGDVLLGCDGLHSAARQLYVDPECRKIYTGSCVIMGYTDLASPGQSPIHLPSGEDGLKEACLLAGPTGSLLFAYYERSRARIFLGSVLVKDEPPDASRDGWNVVGADRKALKAELVHNWKGGQVKGLSETIETCDDWIFYPVYILPRHVNWIRGRVLLLGEAAHAMPVQGESIGIAFDDGLLLAEVFKNRESRTASSLLGDYTSIRQPVVDKLYEAAEVYWKNIHAGIKDKK